MTLREDLLPLVDACRQITEDLDQRTTGLTIRTRTWTSGFVGKTSDPPAVSFTDSDVVFPKRYHIKVLSPEKAQQIVAASAGRLDPGQYVKLWVTPTFDGGGHSQAELMPQGSQGVEILYVLSGVGMNANYTLATFNNDRPYRYELILRRRNDSPPP